MAAQWAMMLLAGWSLISCSESTLTSAAMVVTALEKANEVDGLGAPSVEGSVVTVHYTAWLYDHFAVDHRGEQVMNSRDLNQPLEFVLGSGRVISGWEQGMLGMRAGGRRTLVVPAHLAYGERGVAGVIPPNSALVLDVELVRVH
ncbi:MAG: FKBP-type peptidyl-prolyl cis-trans isomerase [Gammaproteobacteria bacterium]|nr:FKBP-type peptidyl-prolyl cis-trans isomerase [Gammaproteobacteria bacterium]